MENGPFSDSFMRQVSVHFFNLSWVHDKLALLEREYRETSERTHVYSCAVSDNRKKPLSLKVPLNG